jgi:hypothetical protein
MLLSIESDGPVPIYQQIRDRVVEAIARGRLSVGSALPRHRQVPGIPRPPDPGHVDLADLLQADHAHRAGRRFHVQCRA